MRKIHELVEEIKSREKLELIDALYKHGEAVDDGFEVKFEGDEKPVIAGYIDDDPCDIVVSSVLLTHNGEVGINGCDKNNVFCQYADIDPGDIFAGHLSYVTEAVVAAP